MAKVQDLLRELETIPHGARMRRMVEVGRAAAKESQAADTIATLARAGFYGRLLALQSCYGSKDGTQASRSIADPSRILQGRSLRLIALFASDVQAKEALHAARTELRLSLLAQLRRRCRFPPVDQFFDELSRRQPAAVGPLLPFASQALVSRHFELGRQTGGQNFWVRLGRFHPDLALAHFEERLQSAESLDARSLWEANTTLNTLAKRHPKHGLKLAQLLVRNGPSGPIVLERVSFRCSNDVADLMLESEYPFPLSLDRVAHKLDDQRLLQLLEKCPRTLAQPHLWLRRLPPTLRSKVFTAAGNAWRDPECCIAPQILQWLPLVEREKEARRHLQLPVLATRPGPRLAYAMLLPWDDARQLVEPFLNHPEAEYRSAALQALTGATRYARQRVSELLAVLKVRKHEQDPVRCAMLTGLVSLPPSIWKQQHLDDLGQVIRDALSAADLSHASATHAQNLVVGLLPFHPTWSAEWLVTLVREQGQVQLGQLEQRLTDADVRRIAPALQPVLKAWQTREREHQLVQLGWSLGRRLRVFDGLMDIFQHMLHDTATQWVAGSVLQMVAGHYRSQMPTLVPELLKEDPSWITQPPVVEFLHWHRQDLLTPFLGRKAYRGRFSTGNTRHVLPLRQGFFRWTPAQQTTFAQTLEEMTHVRDKMRDIPAVLGAVGQMAALPAIEPKRLKELAADERPAVQEAALRALGRLDAGQGVPVLLEALGDDRARVAIYALRSSLLSMPAAHALQLMRMVPLQKVTVAKEYIRLIGEMPSVEAFRELQRLDGGDLHRDVRVALLRALWGHLEHVEAWDILHRAVDSPDPALMTSVIRIPADRLSDDAQDRLVNLLARVVKHLDPAVRTQVLQRCLVLPVADRRQVLLPLALEAIQSVYPDERAAAAAAVFATSRERDADRVAQGIRDALGNRRALVAAIGALQVAIKVQRQRLLSIARATLSILATDPLAVTLKLQLAGEIATWSEFADLLESHAIEDNLHADAIWTAASAMTAWLHRPNRQELELLEARLTANPDARIRRLALAALVAQAQLTEGWNEARLKRLSAYRLDRSAFVAAAAQLTLPAEET